MKLLVGQGLCQKLLRIGKCVELASFRVCLEHLVGDGFDLRCCKGVSVQALGQRSVSAFVQEDMLHPLRPRSNGTGWDGDKAPCENAISIFVEIVVVLVLKDMDVHIARKPGDQISYRSG